MQLIQGMDQNCKAHVLDTERKYIGEFYEHADQLLDNLDDIKDIFDHYLAVKLYNWRYKWFCDHYEPEEWTIEDDTAWSFEEITFDSISFNVCRNWNLVLDKYFEDERPIFLTADKQASNQCRNKLDNEGLIPYYFRYEIPFPSEFLTNPNLSNDDGERILKDNLTALQLEDYEKEQADMNHVDLEYSLEYHVDLDID